MENKSNYFLRSSKKINNTIDDNDDDDDEYILSQSSSDSDEEEEESLEEEEEEEESLGEEEEESLGEEEEESLGEEEESLGEEEESLGEEESPIEKRKKSKPLTAEEIENLELDKEFFGISKDQVPNTKKYFINLDKDEKKDIIEKIKDIKKDNSEDGKPQLLKILDWETTNKNKSIILGKLNTLEGIREHSEYYKLNNWVNKITKVPFGNFIPSKITNKNSVKEIKKYLEKVKEDFDNSIYGHEKTKKQLLKILAQTISNPDEGGNIFALQGPPGIGKTELIKSGIAKALGRPYSFVSLGGAKDSSYLDGHDYTYEGSNCGRIVDILIETKTMNPIIYFDELDKVSDSSYGQEIINCLMHITDTTQNSCFNDKYFRGIDFDLSKCIMIFSFNDESCISRILRDRMKIIRVKGYKLKDKISIANKFLVPKLLKSIGIENKIIIPDEVLEFIIETYTHEGGVRKFKEILEDILREINLRRLQGNTDFIKVIGDKRKREKDRIIITKELVENDFLKEKRKIDILKINSESKIGVVNGLWANDEGIGGLIPIECSWIPSNEYLKLELTGMQGEVMKESMSVARTISWRIIPEEIKKRLNKKWKGCSENGIHIHCPDGATPKDGPSAGGAITVCLISLLIDKKVNNKIAMTGEINLKGQITAIGGLEEKIFGAIKAGAELVLCPEENKKDLEEIIEKYPNIINDNFKVEIVNNIWQILEKVLIDNNCIFNNF